MHLTVVKQGRKFQVLAGNTVEQDRADEKNVSWKFSRGEFRSAVISLSINRFFHEIHIACGAHGNGQGTRAGRTGLFALGCTVRSRIRGR